MQPARNVELKARLHDVAAARMVALSLATEHLGVQEQTDTYFYCSQGRMKLREIAQLDPAGCEPPRRTAQLIWYDRSDELDAKDSDYLLTEIADSARVVQLKTQMGIRGTVVKRREIFLHRKVRIHLDEVEGLDAFIEFEAVLGPGMSEEAGRAQLDQLQRQFDIQPDDLLATSYSDMILQ